MAKDHLPIHGEGHLMLGIVYWVLRLQRIACTHDWKAVGEAKDAVLGEAVILSCTKCRALVREAVGASA